MKVARSVRQLVAGVIVLALLACVWALVIDYRCTINLDQNDITWEELVAAQAASEEGR